MRKVGSIRDRGLFSRPFVASENRDRGAEEQGSKDNCGVRNAEGRKAVISCQPSAFSKELSVSRKKDSNQFSAKERKLSGGKAPLSFQ